MSSTSTFNTLSKDIVEKLKSNFRNLLNCTRVCGVCLKNTQNLRLGEAVYNITCGEKISRKSLREIVAATFGRKVPTYLPTVYYCERCVDIILKAYQMLEEIKFNHHILQHCANNLDQQTDLLLPDDVESIAFQLNYPKSYEKDSYSSELYEATESDSSISIPEDGIEYEDKLDEESMIKKENSRENVTSNTKKQYKFINDIEEPIILELDPESDSPDENVEDAHIHSKKAPLQSNFLSEIDSRNKIKCTKAPTEKLRHFTCFLCDKVHSRKQNVHTNAYCIKLEGGIRKEVCDHCSTLIASYKFNKRKEEIKQEMESDNEPAETKSRKDKPPLKSCPDCDYKNRNTESLDAHINKYHLHISPYICDKCKKHFHSKSSLREHTKTHTRLKAEQCELCGARFYYKRSLQLHMRMHTGYRPYKCHICDESFISAARRQTHVQTKHMARSFTCDICWKKFHLATILRAHIKKVHLRKDKKRKAENS